MESREQQLAGYQSKLDKSIKLEFLQGTDNWTIVEEVLADLLKETSGRLLNGDPLNHDEYLVNRAKLDGIRAVSDRFNKILKEGKQASDAINTING